ncbi:MAG: hypothetical protein LBT40_11995 [Deltaproteobacteria bacterium]|nr:hypothetical protein [Deltaproteobacteria bacterium]
MIVSSIPGRIRLRSERFKDPELSLDDLTECPGILSWEMNTLTGSLLVMYDPGTVSPLKALQILDRLDPGALLQYAEYLEKTGTDPEAMLASWKGRPAPAARNLPDAEEMGRPVRRHSSAASRELWNEVVGFSVSIVALAVSGFLGVRKFHVVAGMFFLELAAKHAWRYRKRIKPPAGPGLGDFLIPVGHVADGDEDGEAAPKTPSLPGPDGGHEYMC